jgi:hypothetical protein
LNHHRPLYKHRNAPNGPPSPAVLLYCRLRHLTLPALSSDHSKALEAAEEGPCVTLALTPLVIISPHAHTQWPAMAQITLARRFLSFQTSEPSPLVHRLSGKLQKKVPPWPRPLPHWSSPCRWPHWPRPSPRGWMRRWSSRISPLMSS